jgi:hypothetical protein
MASSGLVTFVWHGVNGGLFQLREPEGKAATSFRRAVAANKGSKTIRFRRAGTPVDPKSTFSTRDQDLIQAIRAQKGGRKIVEDLSALPVKCPYPGCEFTVKSNTQKDQLDLAIHFSTAHGENDANDAAGDAE